MKKTMLSTERHSARYRGLDTWDSSEILAALHDGQLAAIASVRAALPALERAANDVVARLQEARGRLVYVGAGASGHLALQDGLEMPGTFGWPANRLVLLMAGAGSSMETLDNGREDDADAGANAIAEQAIAKLDVVIAVAASGGTPYTVAALNAARQRDALTIGIANNPNTALLQAAEHPVLLDTGPEVVAGSTRLNAGTAQKAALGMLSTLIMTRLGHVVDGLMVNMSPDNAKLRERALAMLVTLTDCERDEARNALERCAGQVKAAVLVLNGQTTDQAKALLEDTRGRLRDALQIAISRDAHAGSTPGYGPS